MQSFRNFKVGLAYDPEIPLQSKFTETKSTDNKTKETFTIF